MCEQFITWRDGKFEVSYLERNFIIINVVLLKFSLFIKNTEEIFLNINEMRNFWFEIDRIFYIISRRNCHHINEWIFKNSFKEEKN